jgi:hypothetical protein
VDVRQQAWLEGFTVSEFDPAKLFTAALIDQARKQSEEAARRSQTHRRPSEGS